MSRAPFVPITLDQVNACVGKDFLETFGEVAEHAPWVAEEALDKRPFADLEAMVAAFADAVRAAPRDRRHELLSAHPDLAGTAAVAGEVTEDSAREQAGAGLDTLSPEEFRRFTRLNGHYREKFGIPFIFAVRGATKHDILRGFGERMSGTPEEEFGIAIEQVVRIMRFRLEDRVRS